MAGENELDARTAFKRYHEVSVFFARHAKDLLDALDFEAFHEQVRSLRGKFLRIAGELGQIELDNILGHRWAVLTPRHRPRFAMHVRCLPG